MRRSPPTTQRGFLLITVVLILGVLAAMALMLSTSTSLDNALVAKHAEGATLDYLTESGMQHAEWQLAQNGSCTGYTSLPSTVFGNHSYSATVTPTSGSPVSIVANGTLANGTTRTRTHNDVKSYQVPNVVILQPGSEGIDTYIGNRMDPDTNKNFGAASQLRVSVGSYHTMIHFDLSPIPVGARITSAVLELNFEAADSLSTADISAHQLTRTWNEGTQGGNGATAVTGANWNTYDAVNPWDSPGGDFVATSTATSTINNSPNTPFTWDLTNLARSWHSEHAVNHGVILNVESGNAVNVRFTSSDSSSTAQHPKLTITFACECGKSCAMDSNAPNAHWMLDDGAGLTALDSVGSHNGTLQNSPAWAIGKLGGALDFDGVNDCVDVETFDVNGSGLTLMGWFNADALPAITDPRIISKASGILETDAWWQLSILTSASDRNIRLRVKAGGTTSTLIDSSTNLNAGEWYFAVGTYDEATGEMKLYLNGAEVASRSHPDGGAVDTSATPVAIGANGSAEQFFDGILDDVRVYDRALSAAEIADLYDDGLGGPVAHWKFDDGGGLSAIDSEGGHHGTLYNSPAWTTGTIDGGLEFDGSNDYMRVSDSSDFHLADGTIQAWINADNNSNEQYLFHKDGSDKLYVLVKDGEVTYETNGDTVSGSIQANQWYLVTVSFGSDGMKLYLDGNLVASSSKTDAMVNNNSDIYIGADSAGDKGFGGIIDDIRIYDRALSAAEIADIASGGSGGGGPGYNETYEQWLPTTADAWTAVDLGVFGVPANAVVEVAVTNGNPSFERWVGVRAVGSSLERRIQLHEAEAGGEDVAVLHVQADDSSRIEYYADTAGTELRFVLLGYWASGTYVERFDSFPATVSNLWHDRNLAPFGVSAGQTAEIVITNVSTSSESMGGVRSVGSSLDRWVDLHDAEGEGEDMATMIVNADGSPDATIQVYAEADAQNRFFLVGYWSTPPGIYVETFVELSGAPASSSAWKDEDLTSARVPANAVVQIVMANGQDTAEGKIGIREKGSGLDRTLNLHEAEAGGDDLVSLHVNTDGGSGIQWYDENTGQDHRFYLLGWWVLTP